MGKKEKEIETLYGKEGDRDSVWGRKRSLCTLGCACLLVVLACESLYMHALCASGAVNMQDFVSKFLCALYKLLFIHYFIISFIHSARR